MSLHPFLHRKQHELGIALNDVQQKAVLTTEGPLLLLASPGSGKTTTIIMRIGYLIEEKGVDPTRIKAVTFSRASAADMKERYQAFFPNLDSVDFSTIHSLAFQVVREYLRKQRVTYELIEGEVDRPQYHKRMVLRDLYAQLNEESITDDQLEELSTYISLVKNKLLPEEQWQEVECDVTNAYEILRQYESFKQQTSFHLLVDYDDMLTIAHEAFENDYELLSKYQNQFDYVLTDESQDTSMVQHSIIEKLVSNHQNLCVVADDDQSIYTWRAAEPKYLLDFQKVYPNAQILKMEQNYRSSQEIVQTANRFIKQNKNRYDKNMFTENSTHEQVQLKSFHSDHEQIEYVIEELKKAKGYQNIALLYRNNSSSIVLADALNEAGIPFYMKDSDHRFFNHWVVQDILNFMRLAYDPTRMDIFEKVFSKFHGYLSKYQVDQARRGPKDRSVFDLLISYGQLKDFQVKKFKYYQSIYQKMHEHSSKEVIRQIRKELGYERVIKDMCKRLGFNEEGLLETLNLLEVIAEKVDDMVSFAKRLQHLETLMKQSKFNKHQNAVTLSTFHSAKGLEFPAVFMVDLIQGVIPARSDIEAYKESDKEPMEEAVRLFYVGMTRAETRLELLTYGKKFNAKVQPSKFYFDVDRIVNPSKKKQKPEVKKKQHNPNAIQSEEEISVGLKVKHRVFGEGEVVDHMSDYIMVQFEGDIKELALKTCVEFGLIEVLDQRV
ncbi:DNA helicase-2/ATP-dependent DNA helicase PcrA [Alkalibacillus filiformis]|uniref:DNA 3'-5' helicase n=1 Tax=Alkalibacillus filiformis TaxID=200990 RepID=A0ABU0DU86_9BACI|nr:ATP-dependent helicase [Alkalibacillus filiformis]MDQ0352026.1 DNA helicase-2/ATP-dependent DNA helicase PcrA [Alkalibacillus filiformis]